MSWNDARGEGEACLYDGNPDTKGLFFGQAVTTDRGVRLEVAPCARPIIQLAGVVIERTGLVLTVANDTWRCPERAPVRVGYLAHTWENDGWPTAHGATITLPFPPRDETPPEAPPPADPVPPALDERLAAIESRLSALEAVATPAPLPPPLPETEPSAQPVTKVEPAPFRPGRYRQLLSITRPGYERAAAAFVLASTSTHCLVAAQIPLWYYGLEVAWGDLVPVAGAGFRNESPFARGLSGAEHAAWALYIFARPVAADLVCGLFLPDTTFRPPATPMQSPPVRVHHYAGYDPHSAEDVWLPYAFRDTVTWIAPLTQEWPSGTKYYPEDGVGVHGSSGNPFLIERTDGRAAYGGSAKTRQPVAPYGIDTNSAHGLYALWAALPARWSDLEPEIVGHPAADPARLPDTTATMKIFP